MARSSEQITQNEINSYKRFCGERGVIHDRSQDDQQNADFILNYFVNVWKQDITEQNLNTAWEHIRPHLKIYTPAQAEYFKAANRETDRANQLVNWLATHGGKPGTLVNTGDQYFENLSLLLGTLQGYEISTPRIQDAENRIANRAGRKLHYVPTPRREMGTITEAARNDDGTPFVTSGLTLQRDGTLGKSPADYAREARARSERDAEAANQQRTGASAQSRTAAEAKSKAEGLRGNTHSEDAQIGRIFVTTPGTSDINWPATLDARLALQKSLNRAQEVRRFIR